MIDSIQNNNNYVYGCIPHHQRHADLAVCMCVKIMGDKLLGLRINIKF
jgi:hypothetical protein